jgi:hypothetical protein
MKTETETTAHTPGPWFEIEGRVYGADGFEVVDATQGPHLHKDHDGSKGHWGSTPGSHVEREEDEEAANARLIAASPDLLEAAKRAYITFRRSNYKSGDSRDENESYAIQGLVIAIAKAEGNWPMPGPPLAAAEDRA